MLPSIVCHPYKFSWSHIQPTAYTLHVPMLPSIVCHPYKLSWSHLQPATYIMYVIPFPFSMPLMQFTQHFHQEYLCLVYLGTRCFSCYFCPQCLTSTAALKDVTGFFKSIFIGYWRCPWCNGYRHGKCTRQHEFISWTRLVAFHIALIPLGKVWIQLFSLQLWVNSRTD